MILTCPECATSFKVADNAIGPNGRTVRCSKCNTSWFVAAEPDVLALNDELDKTAQAEPDDTHAAPADDIAASTIAPHAMIREKAERKKIRKRLFGVGMIWLVTLSLLAAMALAAYLFRAKIVELFPGTAPVYRAFGLEANIRGLEFYDIKSKYGTNEGVRVLFVNGRIKNFARREKQLDLIRFRFKNNNGETIASWVIEPPKQILKPGESVKFATQYPNPPVDAARLVQDFVDENIISKNDYKPAGDMAGR